ncbi:MAG: hypothetical protein KA054_03320 [Candidatus Moranbacteria bacterium]|nr:hypothetical protein [Candidatus Moranbacteria bacterium]
MSSISVASWVDVFQLGKQLLAYLNMGGEKKPEPVATKPAEDKPESVLAARFTTVDEAVYCGNLKGLLSDTDESAIDLIETQMKSHQVEQFRLMILNMVNHPVRKDTMVPVLDKAGKDTGQKKPVTEMVDLAFTEKDTRVLRLQSYAKKILTGVGKAAQEDLAKAIVAKLLQEGSITEKSMSDIAREKLLGAKQAVSDGSYNGLAFVQLGDKYTAIQKTNAGEATKAKRISAALDAKLVAKKAELDTLGFKSMLTNKWTYAFVLPVIIGFIYILFL